MALAPTQGNGLTNFGAVRWKEGTRGTFVVEMPKAMMEHVLQMTILPERSTQADKPQPSRKRPFYKRAWTKEMNAELLKMDESKKSVSEIADYVLSTPSFGSRTREATKRHVRRLVTRRRLANSATDASSTSDYVSEMNASTTAPSASGESNDGSSPAGRILPTTETPTTSQEPAGVSGPA